ncbi:MAG: glycosyltransferase family 4 protein [Nitrospirae bacterium]|nr:glycosyltransferase family 4 protein [Nitrospirota bacterium]
MKVLLTNFHPYFGGGHTTYLLYLFRELNTFNDVYLACPKTSKLNRLAKEIKGDNVFDIDFPGKIREIKHIAGNLNKLVPIIKNIDFDLIHVNGSPDHSMIIYSKLLLRNKTPVIKTIHNSLVPKKGLLSSVKRYFTDGIILPSNFQTRMMIENGYGNDEFTVIHNGIDTDHFYFARKSGALRNKYNINNTDIVFVSTAGTALHKGWHLLVEAVSRLDNRLRDRIKIIIAGNLPGKEIMETYVNKFNMRDNVIFTGLLQDVREVVALADVGFVLSHRIESISYACREMMSMGKPVLISDYAGLPENIDDGINGWITETLSVSSIAFRVAEIVKNADALDKFSAAARKKAEKDFSLKVFVDKTYNCYESTLSNSHQQNRRPGRKTFF